MKSLFLLSACGLALMSLSACGPTTPATARVALDCPSDQGDLKLSTMAADKKTCSYTSRNGDEVSLRLIPVSSTYEAALLPIETELQGEQETAAPAADAKASGAQVDTKAAKGSAADAAKAAKEAENDAFHELRKDRNEADADAHDNDHVSIGGGAIVADSGAHGDHANINLPGIHISADDDKANVSVGGVHVDAGEDGATVRMSRDVRLRGEALSRERRGFRSTYILAKDNLKDGWKAVGYEAAGPKAGPITVAVFKAHHGDHHDVSEDVKRLVRRNAGV
ncbi:MAG: hypothetical protein ACXU8S_15865 [Phenylobacterium sp.]